MFLTAGEWNLLKHLRSKPNILGALGDNVLVMIVSRRLDDIIMPRSLCDS